jgi:hypothetical protein
MINEWFNGSLRGDNGWRPVKCRPPAYLARPACNMLRRNIHSRSANARRTPFPMSQAGRQKRGGKLTKPVAGVQVVSARNAGDKAVIRATHVPSAIQASPGACQHRYHHLTEARATPKWAGELAVVREITGDSARRKRASSPGRLSLHARIVDSDQESAVL